MPVSCSLQSLTPFLTQCIDEEWGIVCQKYQEELAGLKSLRRSVTQTLSKLRIETEKLQREDEVIRDQEEKLLQGYEQLEQKHGQYRAKGESCDSVSSFDTSADVNIFDFGSSSCFTRNESYSDSLRYKTGWRTSRILRLSDYLAINPSFRKSSIRAHIFPQDTPYLCTIHFLQFLFLCSKRLSLRHLYTTVAPLLERYRFIKRNSPF